jgi:carbon storage regulator CsrA
MLILTRKIDQSIVIQGNIQIVVLGVERDRVKLGIAAPAEVSVLREELVEDQGNNAPLPLRRRPAPNNVAATHGNLALDPKNE